MNYKEIMEKPEERRVILNLFETHFGDTGDGSVNNLLTSLEEGGNYPYINMCEIFAREYPYFKRDLLLSSDSDLDRIPKGMYMHSEILDMQIPARINNIDKDAFVGNTFIQRITFLSSEDKQYALKFDSSVLSNLVKSTSIKEVVLPYPYITYSNTDEDKDEFPTLADTSIYSELKFLPTLEFYFTDSSWGNSAASVYLNFATFIFSLIRDGKMDLPDGLSDSPSPEDVWKVITTDYIKALRNVFISYNGGVVCVADLNKLWKAEKKAKKNQSNISSDNSKNAEKSSKDVSQNSSEESDDDTVPETNQSVDAASDETSIVDNESDESNNEEPVEEED